MKRTKQLTHRQLQTIINRQNLDILGLKGTQDSLMDTVRVMDLAACVLRTDINTRKDDLRKVDAINIGLHEQLDTLQQLHYSDMEQIDQLTKTNNEFSNQLSNAERKLIIISETIQL
jgi:hypothetical protein